MRARFAGFAILLVIVALLAVLLWYRQASLPVHEGTFIVTGLQQPVRIDRDAHGIPTIVAANSGVTTLRLIMSTTAPVALPSVISHLPA